MEENQEEKYFRETVEVYNDQFSKLYLCKLIKMSKLDEKELLFIDNGLNILCKGKLYGDIEFVKAKDLEQKVDFQSERKVLEDRIPSDPIIFK